MTTAASAAGATTGTTRHLTLRCQFCRTWNRIDTARAADKPKCGQCAKPMLLDRPYPLDDETFARTIADAEVPVLVDFYADWCGPCKMMAPSVDKLAEARQGQALIAKLDTERASETAQQFNIRGIPTVIVFKGGKPVVQQSGAMPYNGLEMMLDSAMTA